MTFPAFLPAAALILALASPALADTVTVRNDGGGNVSRYIDLRQRLSRAESVRIEGKCFSSCTIFTTLPNACVMPNAQLGFHGTSPRVPLLQRWLDNRLGRYYRGDVRRLYMSAWRHVHGKNLHVISGRELARLDPQIKLCR